jgi:EAL domain-containing protein (putative c-di-GMP-specific phosphodiesterase class I)
MIKQPADVLLVDDEVSVRGALSRILERAGNWVVEAAESAQDALALLRAGKRFDAIVTDLQMPGMTGVDFIRSLRQMDLDVPVIVLTGNPSLESAIAVIQYGGFRYLQKPVPSATLLETVHEAAVLHRLAVLKRRALELCEAGGWLLGDQASLEAHFDSALNQLWIAFQPIVEWPGQQIFGYEALVRSPEATLATPGLLFDAAERLGRVQDLGIAIRRAVAARLGGAPDGSVIFTNLHALDLMNDELYDIRSPLSAYAFRVVLEVTERASLHRIEDLPARIAQLRQLGYRIAIDDLGAGYAGLSSFSQLEPDMAKLDMSLVRGVDASSSKASLVRSMINLCPVNSASASLRGRRDARRTRCVTSSGRRLATRFSVCSSGTCFPRRKHLSADSIFLSGCAFEHRVLP